jgi:uncharacterized protein YxjI
MAMMLWLMAGRTGTDMHYVMKEKWFSWGDDFTIKTDDGQGAFFVDGKG